MHSTVDAADLEGGTGSLRAAHNCPSRALLQLLLRGIPGKMLPVVCTYVCS